MGCLDDLRPSERLQRGRCNASLSSVVAASFCAWQIVCAGIPSRGLQAPPPHLLASARAAAQTRTVSARLVNDLGPCRDTRDDASRIWGRGVLSSYVLSASDLREPTQRSLHARGYRAVRVGSLKGRALAVEHPPEELNHLDTLMRSLDPGVRRIQPDKPAKPPVVPPAPRQPDTSRWRSVWW
jgi:hypothetical protein